MMNVGFRPVNAPVQKDVRFGTKLKIDDVKCYVDGKKEAQEIRDFAEQIKNDGIDETLTIKARHISVSGFPVEGHVSGYNAHIITAHPSGQFRQIRGLLPQIKNIYEQLPSFMKDNETVEEQDERRSQINEILDF